MAAQGPQTVSVTPSSGSGSSQTFTLVYTDGPGAADLKASAQAIINASAKRRIVVLRLGDAGHGDSVAGKRRRQLAGGADVGVRRERCRTANAR